MLALIGITFFSLLTLGAPIGFTLGITALFALLKLGNPMFLKLVSQRFYTGVDSFPIMAMPLFMLAGDIMNRSGITHRLVAVANLLVGHLRGGLAQVNVVDSMLFGGISGSAVADVASLGSIVIPAMTDDGYDKPFSAAITAATAVMGPIIPPSIIMVIYGSIMNVSIAGMFSAGIPTGILMGVLMLLVNHFILAPKKHFPKGKPKKTFQEAVVILQEGLVALVMPLIILGGILGGVFTATEAAAVAVAYSFLVGFLVFRTLKIQDLPDIFFRAAITTGMIFLIMSSASILSWVLAMERVPERVAKMLLSITTNKYWMLLLINIFLLIVGCFMDITAALIILAPILAPLAHNMGIHPIHFGLIMCVNLCIALITPPVGACLFVACGIGKVTLEEISREIWPFVIIEVTVLMIITYFPCVTMFVPKLLGFY